VRSREKFKSRLHCLLHVDSKMVVAVLVLVCVISNNLSTTVCCVNVITLCVYKVFAELLYFA